MVSRGSRRRWDLYVRNRTDRGCGNARASALAALVARASVCVVSLRLFYIPSAPLRRNVFRRAVLTDRT